MKKIRILYNDRRDFPIQHGSADDAFADWDVRETIDLLSATISGLGFECSCSRVVDGSLEFLQGEFDLAFNICELTGGSFREAVIPALLEFMGIPFTFSRAATMHLTLDKYLTNLILVDAGIRVPTSFLMKRYDDPIPGDHCFPLIVKPNHEGSGMGITDNSIVSDVGQLRRVVSNLISHYKQPALVQQFVSGHEITVGVVSVCGQPVSLSPLRIGIGNNEVYGYSRKEQSHLLEYTMLAEPDKSLLTKLSTRLFLLLECGDAARFDFRICERTGKVYFLECNPLPHLHPKIGDFCRSAIAAGLDYSDLIRLIIDSAFARSEKLRSP